MIATSDERIPELIWSYDLAPISARLEAEGHANAPQLETEFRRVAALWYLYPDAGIAPSTEIDAFWHAFILDTRRYRDFCERVFGRYMDHCIDDTKSGMWGPYEQTKSLYAVHFGAPGAALWGPLGANSMQCQRPPD